MKLTASEEEVMNLLWKSDIAMTASEIVKFSVNRSWKPSYIHIMINSLLKKEMIQVAGFKQTTKNYARTYKPTISKDQWIAKTLSENNSILSVFSTLINSVTDVTTINQMMEEVKKKKQIISST